VVTAIHLVRHGHHGLIGRVLCGRMDGVGLDAEGRDEMTACAAVLVPEGIEVLQASPRQRTQESAALLAGPLGLAVETAPAIDELDAGDWTGLSFDELATDPRWTAWNTSRGVAQPPNGESMVALQQRVLAHLDALRHGPARRVVLVSHAEPIRAALLHYLDRPLDDFQSVEVSPGTVSTLLLDESGGRVTRLNHGGRA
jgi:probable phosphoglycerate mutase